MTSPYNSCIKDIAARMLYIFFVNTGSMISVNMQLALESVAQLKSEIAHRTGIVEDKQVLLVSGGQSLNSDERVCSYSAGTDTSPIFLYSKSAIESEEPPAASVDYFSDFDMNEQVEGSLNMPATYQTVVSRAQLAQTFYEVAKSLRVSCERLVYDEHLQQQGWAAAVANLEDTASSFGRKAFIIKENFNEYLKTRSHHLELIQSFSSDLGLLAKIPVLPVLLTKQDDEHQNSEITLLNWISSKDKKSTLDEILNRCIAGLNAIDRNILDNICSEAQKVLETVDNHQMKEVKGLGERLFGLDELISNAKVLEKEQGDLARALLNNQTQAGKCGDAAIYSDLCITHRKQLELLLNNHNHLKDIHKRCSVAKEELCQNLHSRLRWMMFVQNTIVGIENKLMMFYCKLEQLKRYLEFVQKIHVAPKIYLNAIVEVVRRRHFSKNFSQWAGSLSHQSSELHEKEIATRREFNCQIANHFLQPLFPGMADFPPPFAVEAPALFDQDLPNIGIDDIEKLKQRIPELATYLRLSIHDVMPKAITTPTDSALGSEVPSSRVFGTCSIASPISLDPLSHILETHEFTAEGFSEIDRELFSVASEPSPTSESFVCTDSEGIPKQHPKSPIRKGDGDNCKQPHSFDSNQEKEVYSPIEEEHEEDSDADEFEQVGEMLKDQSTTELIKVGIHTSEESSMKDRLQKASSEPEESKLNQSTEVIVLTRTRSDGDIHMHTSDLVTSSASQEFLTADFFIDESMPSSYTESNGTTKGNQLLKSHHMVVAELQRQLEDKTAILIAVQEDLDTSRAQLQKIHCAVGSLQRLAEEVKNQLKYDVIQLKDQVLHDKGMFLQEIANLAAHLKTSLENLQRKMQNDKELAIQEAMEQAQEEHQHVVQQYENKLEVQSQNLEDMQRQADIYYDQLRHHCMLLDNEKLDSEAKLEALRRELTEKHQEIVQKMMLEHELELENSTEEFKKELDSKEKEFCYLKEALAEKENQIHLLCEDKLSLESVYVDKFQQKKIELQRTIEEKYKERERAVICQALETQDATHKRELQSVHIQKENMERELRKEIAKTMQIEWDGSLQDCREKLQAYYEKQLLEKERQWEAERNSALCTLREALERDHKRKIELLHSYFRLASHVTSLQPSPNEYSLLERIQMDYGEEQARQLKEALIHSEKEFEGVRFDDETITTHKQHHEEMMSGKLGLETEKEMSYSDATCSFVRKDQDMEESYKETGSTSQLMLDSAMQEKVDISGMNQLLLDLLQQEKETSEMKQKLKAEVTELQKKLLETENKLSMHSSVPVVMDTAEKDPSHDSTILELQMKLRNKEAEIAAVKQNLGEAQTLPCSHTHVHSDKVSVLTCNVGDIVLLCYNEKHENYVVFYLGSALHFLHTDCLEAFGFKNASTENHKTWAIAEVVDKEYCLAKKAHNRYKVQVGTRFYRIKAKPWDDQMAARRQNHQKRSSSAGGSTSTSETSRSTSLLATDSASESSTMSASVI